MVELAVQRAEERQVILNPEVYLEVMEQTFKDWENELADKNPDGLPKYVVISLIFTAIRISIYMYNFNSFSLHFLYFICTILTMIP